MATKAFSLIWEQESEKLINEYKVPSFESVNKVALCDHQTGTSELTYYNLCMESKFWFRYR